MKNKETKISKSSKTRQRKIIIRSIIGAGFVAGVLVCAYVANLVFGVIQNTAAFDEQKVLRYEPFTILDANDKEIFKRGVEPVDFDEIPQVMIDAIVAAEDSRYYEHNGFDIPRIIKAALGNFIGGGISSGASTITQQVIKKNYFPNEEQTYQRKISEIFLAIQADEQMTKDKIIECYFNTIYFGMGPQTRGIKAGARYYFNKDVSQLTLPEAAYLAGVINAPSSYDAYYNLDNATARRNIILDLMELHGYISSAECELAKQTKLENQLQKEPLSGGTYSKYQAYIDAVVEEAVYAVNSDKTREEVDAEFDTLREELMDKSITIHTFMNPAIQSYLEVDIASGEPRYINYYGDIELAGAVQDAYNGRVIGLLGGRDYWKWQLNSGLEGPKMFGYNRATTGKQSPGSSLKPLLAYGSGFEFLKWPTYACVEDNEYYTPDGVRIKNFDNGYHGIQSFKEALGNSWNITALKCFQEVYYEIGEKATIDYVNGLGLDVNDAYDSNGNVIVDGDFNLLYTVGGWAEGVTMMAEAGAYGPVVNGGIWYEPHTINYIEYNNDNTRINVDENVAANSHRAMSEETSFMIRELMKEYTHGGIGSYYQIANEASDCGIKVGAKSGTSTNTDGDNKGYILAAFTPDYTMAFWLGKDNSSEVISSDNSMTPRGMAADVIYELHKNGTTHEYKAMPDTLGRATVQKGKTPSETYYLAGDWVPDKYRVTGYYYKSNPPKAAVTPVAPSLGSFSADRDGSTISVSFGEGSASEDMIRMYGKLVYATVVRDLSTGAEIYSTSSEDRHYSFTIKFDGDIQVCGRVHHKDASSISSSESCETFKSDVTYLDPDIDYYYDTDYSTYCNIFVNAMYSDNIITIYMEDPYGNGVTREFTGYGEASFSELGQIITGEYYIEVTERDSRRTNSVTNTFTVNMVASESDDADEE